MELDALRRRQQLDAHHRRRVFGHVQQAPRAVRGHRDVIFLIGAGRDRVHAARMGHHPVLGDQGGGRHLGDHEAGVQPAFLDQKGRQFAHLRIDQDGGATLGDIADLAQSHGDLIGCESNGFGVEVAARDHVAVLDEDQRIVGDGVGLALQRRGGGPQHVQHGAHDLGLTAQGVGVLHLGAVVAMAVANGRTVDQGAQGRGHGDLAGLAAQGVDARIERGVGSLQRIDRQGARRQAGREHRLGREQARQRQRRRTLGAVQQRQTLLGAERQRRQARARQRRFGLQRLAIHPRLSHADQGAGHMGQRRQIAGRPDRSLGRNAGQDVGVDQGDQGLQRLAPDARCAARQGGDLQHHQQPRDRIGQQRTDAAGMAQHQILLKGFKVLRRNAGVGQEAESGVHPIDGAALSHDRRHGRRAPFHIGPGAGRDGHHHRAVQHGAKLGQGQGRVADGQHGHRQAFRLGRFSSWSRAAARAISYPASAWRMTPVAGSFHRTRSSRLAASGVPSATMTTPECWE